MNDNEDETIDWEEQALAYQEALETALTYQHDLEQKISELEQAIKQQGQRYRDEPWPADENACSAQTSRDSQRDPSADDSHTNTTDH